MFTGAHNISRTAECRWEDAVLPAMRDRDICRKAVEAYKTAAADEAAERAADAEYIAGLGLMTDGCYTNAAALMFTEHPEYWVAGATIKIGFFDEDGNVLGKRTICGPALGQADEAMTVLSAKYTRVYNACLPFPEDAVKEAVLNAVIHKDYAAGQPVQVRLCRESLRILSSGGLPEGWTTETLARPHISSPRNPRLAALFARAGRTAGRGTGTERMSRACAKAGLPAPEYSVSGFGFCVEFHAADGGGSA